MESDGESSSGDDDHRKARHADSKTRNVDPAESQNIFQKYRIYITFLPVMIVLPFDKLMAFCLFIMLMEKTVLSTLSFPGLEFTTTATFLFGYRYGLVNGILLTLLVPNIALKLLKFWLWREYVNPDEWPVNFGLTTLIDFVVCAFGYMASQLSGVPLLAVFVLTLGVKSILNILRTRSSDVPEYMHSAVSSAVNLLLMIFIYKFVFHIIIA